MSEISTESSVDDGKAFPKVLQQVQGRPNTLTGDGAYNDRDVRELIREKGGKVLIPPPPSNAVCHGVDRDCDRAVLDIRAFGGDIVV